MATYQGPQNSGGGGGGTVEAVVAGTNITVDATDPANPIVANTYSAAGAISTHAALTTTHGISAFGSTLVDDADAAAARTTLGLGSVENTALSTWAGSTAITTLGTIATGTWSGTAIAANKGGTGQTTYAVGDILYASSTSALSRLAVGTNGYVLTLAAGVPTWAAASSGVTGFTGAQNTASPNNTNNVSSLTVSASSTNAYAAIVPKGTGGIIAAIPDSATAGGNVRGDYAVDLQTKRSAAAHVASGLYSGVLSGQSNKATGLNAVVPGGALCQATGDNSIAAGNSSVASGTGSVALGGSTAGGTYAVALGGGNSAPAAYSFSAGQSTTANATCSTVFGGDVGSVTVNSGCDGALVNLGNGSVTAALRCVVTGEFGFTEGGVSNGYFIGGRVTNSAGEAQSGMFQIGTVTSSATPVNMYRNANTGTYQTFMINSAYVFDVLIVAKVSGTGSKDIAVFHRRLVVNTYSGGPRTVGSVQTIGTDIADAGAAGWSVALSFDSSHRLIVACTGQSATTINWTANVRYAKIAG